MLYLNLNFVVPPCRYKEEGDDYSYIMAEALADRLAEAFAEKLHEMVRRSDWGYAPQEALAVDEMLKVRHAAYTMHPEQDSNCLASVQLFFIVEAIAQQPGRQALPLLRAVLL